MANRRRTTILWTISATTLTGALAVATSFATAGETGGGGPDTSGPSSPPPDVLAETIPLPDAFQPEGIAIGTEPVAFFGSLADGAIFKADLVTGEGEVLGTAPGTPSVGMKIDDVGRLFVAGGRAGDARVIDTETGEVLASFDLAVEQEAFVNDVVLTEAGAFFTDSTNPVIYHLPIDNEGGIEEGENGLPGPDDVVRIPLTGDIVYDEGINANGIALSPDRESLIIVQSNTGLLFTVDPATGVTEQVGVVAADGDGLLPNGDGLLVLGQTLVVVQNRLNTLTVLQVNAAGTQADIVDAITDERFDVPTTVAAFDDRLYLPNARFGVDVTPDTEYVAVSVGGL